MALLNLEPLRDGLIVSCQAHEQEPLHGSIHMAKMALAAKAGGAAAVRANSPGDIRAIRAEVDLPIVGIYKLPHKEDEAYITPDMESARAIIEAGSDIVAIDCTNRPSCRGFYGNDLIRQVKASYNIRIMADISTLDEAIAAFESGADIIATTLSGLTAYSPQIETPDFLLIEEIRKALPKAFINAEGRIATPADFIRAFECGADTVTVGTAITRPQWITEQFTKAIKRRH